MSPAARRSAARPTDICDCCWMLPPLSRCRSRLADTMPSVRSPAATRTSRPDRLVTPVNRLLVLSSSRSPCPAPSNVVPDWMRPACCSTLLREETSDRLLAVMSPPMRMPSTPVIDTWLPVSAVAVRTCPALDSRFSRLVPVLTAVPPRSISPVVTSCTAPLLPLRRLSTSRPPSALSRMDWPWAAIAPSNVLPGVSSCTLPLAARSLRPFTFTTALCSRLPAWAVARRSPVAFTPARVSAPALSMRMSRPDNCTPVANVLFTLSSTTSPVALNTAVPATASAVLWVMPAPLCTCRLAACTEPRCTPRPLSRAAPVVVTEPRFSALSALRVMLLPAALTAPPNWLVPSPSTMSPVAVQVLALSTPTAPVWLMLPPVAVTVLVWPSATLSSLTASPVKAVDCAMVASRRVSRAPALACSVVASRPDRVSAPRPLIWTVLPLSATSPMNWLAVFCRVMLPSEVKSAFPPT